MFSQPLASDAVSLFVNETRSHGGDWLSRQTLCGVGTTQLIEWLGSKVSGHFRKPSALGITVLPVPCTEGTFIGGQTLR